MSNGPPASASHYPAQTVKEKTERHTLSVLVDNEPGVLARVIGLFSGRGYNIESLTVARTMDPELSRMTIVVETDAAAARRIEAHLWKLVNVIRVEDATREVERDLPAIDVEQRDAVERRERVLVNGRLVPESRRVVLPELEAQRGIVQNKIDGEDLFDHTLRTVDAAPAGRPTISRR